MIKALTTYFILFLAVFCVPAFADEPAAQSHGRISVQADIQDLDIGDMAWFSAEGNVRITYGDQILTADRVNGNRETGEMVAAGNVRLSDLRGTLTTSSITHNLKSGRFSAESDVYGTFTADDGSEVILTSQDLTGSTTDRTVSAFGKVTLTGDMGRLTCNNLDYNLTTRDFVASGSVHGRVRDADGEEMILTASRIEGNVSNQDVRASGGVMMNSDRGDLTGDHLLYNLQTKLFSADGSVRVVYKDMEGEDVVLTAETVNGSTETGDVEAAGNVYFRSAKRSLTGDTFSYNYMEETGIARNAAANVDNFYFRGEEMRSDPNQYLIRNSRFTTCDLDDPHYHLSARELRLKPGERFVARDVSINLFGTRILNVPRYEANLRERQSSGLIIPSIGYSSRYGLYAGHVFNLSQGTETQGVLDLRLSTKNTVQGGLMYDRIKGQPIYARATYRQPFYGGTRNDLLVTRLPEIGYRYASGDDAQSYSAPREALGLSRTLVNPLRSSSNHKGINVLGDASLGHFIEDPGDVSSGRVDGRAVAWMGNLLDDDRTIISPAISARYSNYGDSQDYSSLGFRLAVARKLGSDSYVSLAYITHAIHGSTPFEFDRIELPQELAAAYRVPFGDYSIQIGGRYDLKSGGFYDSEITLARKLHCLEPRITWRNRHKELSFSIGLVGF